jgi:hypothetical protein
MRGFSVRGSGEFSLPLPAVFASSAESETDPLMDQIRQAEKRQRLVNEEIQRRCVERMEG